jgi:hypothetical protein
LVSGVCGGGARGAPPPPMTVLLRWDDAVLTLCVLFSNSREC